MGKEQEPKVMMLVWSRSMGKIGWGQKWPHAVNSGTTGSLATCPWFVYETVRSPARLPELSYSSAKAQAEKLLCWRETYYRSFYMHKLILRRVATCIPPYMTDTLRCNQHTFQKQIMKHKESYKSETSLKGGGCGAHINTSFKNLLSAISLQWDSIFRPTNT